MLSCPDATDSRKRTKDASFSEEKEAKRLLFLGRFGMIAAAGRV
jgi:hypothetical protein